MHRATSGALVVLAVMSTSALVPTLAVASDGTDTTVPATSTPAPDTVVPDPSTIGTPSTDTAPGTTSVPPTPGRTTSPRSVGVRVASVVVALDSQTAYVYSATRRLIATFPVSTGLANSTPTGSFRVFSKSAQTFYTPSPSEKMRWMVRFTKGRRGGNIGFHGIPYRVTAKGEVPFPTPLGEKPSSHGCVRMAVADAKWLFHNIDIGTRVRVVRTREG